MRAEDTSSGFMVGQGQHMHRNGYSGPFYLKGEHDKKRVTAAMEVGGARLGEHFTGRGGGVGELARQAEAHVAREVGWYLASLLERVGGVGQCHAHRQGWLALVRRLGVASR